MITSTDEARQLRHRLEALEGEVSRVRRTAPPSSASLVAITTDDGVYPTTANAMFPVAQTDPIAIEAEGETVGFDTAGEIFYAAGIGTAVPPLDTRLLLALTGGVWAFQYDGPEAEAP